MSTRKKDAAKTVQDIHASILEALSTIKQLLDDRKHPQYSSLPEKLTHVASLAESFTEQRSKSAKSTWTNLADSLDQEGVNLWNISGLIPKVSDGAGQAHLATLRLAAFRLVEAGMEMKPGTDTLIHALQLASKTGVCLSEHGMNVLAVGVLTSAAKVSYAHVSYLTLLERLSTQYEEQLKNVDTPDETQRRLIACATTMYYSSRMEAAWRDGNDGLAEYMSRKITDDNQHLSFLPPHAKELLAHKLHQIAGSFLTPAQGRSKATDAIQWLQRAFSVADQLEDTTTSGIPGLKVSIMRTMGRMLQVGSLQQYLDVVSSARAYFMSEAYDRAESVLNELMPFIDSSNDRSTSEYQELRWLRLSVLKKRDAGYASLLTAFKSIVDHMEFTELNITDVLQDLRTLNNHFTLVTAVHQYVLSQCLERDKVEPTHIHRLIMSSIIHSSKDEDHPRAMKTIESTFTSIFQAEIEIPSVICTACLTLIWQYGGRHYKSKKWLEAAEWYLAGTHELFRANSPLTLAKCFRKAALCHIEQREYALASTVIRRCSTNEAATHYIIFLTAVHQGLESESIRAIQDMVKAPDFDRKMLLVATQISHQSEMKSVLLVVLESLLKTLKIGSNGDAVVEAMTLMRCIVRLVLSLLLEPAANKPVLIDIVVKQFRTARLLTETAVSQKVVPLVFKDISWLWRTAYNCAVQGCAEWENAGDQISELFDVARELLDYCCHASPVEIDAEVCIHLANASFAAVSGRVFSAREIIVTTEVIDENNLRTLLVEINKAQQKMDDILGKRIVLETRDSDRIQYFLHALRVFQAEFSAHLKDWDQLSQDVDEIAHSGPLAFGTYEAIADILWLDSACPVHVLSKYLEAILRASLNQSSLSVEKFSRWLRAICTISLSRDTPPDRLKAIGYVEHAVSVIEDHHEGEESYPMDERQWLLATAYNTGTECLHASLLDEAKRWFEISTVICRFVPGGKSRAEKISETYTHLLSRYGNNP